MALEWRNINFRKEEIFKFLKPGDVITVFDTETTGLGSSAKIIQFSAVKYRIEKDLSLTEIGIIDLYINPEMNLPEKITELTGITDEMLKDMPTEKEIGPKLLEFIEDSDVLAAYNIKFDLRMIDCLCNRIHLCYDMAPTLDILEMARDFIPKEKINNHKLGTVVAYIFPDDDFQFHSAIEDVRATAKVMEVFLKAYWKYSSKNEEKTPIHLERGHLFINPRKASQQRIIAEINKGNEGDIFYDIVAHCWSCKCNSKAKKLFNEIDLEELERQFLLKYHYNSMDELAKSWLKYRRQQKAKQA